uniref:Uncharacterized protein n=1 Tax=uncultured bacterium fosmid pJB39A3 TaxID=1478063 RepID=A0A0H3U7P4_9BACT|nr:hypothetical protein [uncultured bacterium fosmid pJB39A3]
MNKKFRIIAVIAVLLAVISFAGASFAWLSGANDIDVAIESSVLVQYFESGKGTKEEPFIIHTPRHLYNLAWLQYLGQFNGTKDDNIEITQYYFELCDGTSAVGHQGIEDGVLDMSSWVLPPIGTPEHPFVGHFEGNGITIANLTVSGNYDDLSDAADTKVNFDKCAYDSYTNEGCDIVGLFGVVGSVTDEAGKIGTKTYNTAVNSVSNVDIDNITVQTETYTSLIGVVAGYVNGTIEGVGVANSNVRIASDVEALDVLEFTDALSDYGTIGFCEAAYKGTIDITEAKASDPTLKLRTMSSEEEGTHWGGSISMKDMYTRLSGMYKDAEQIKVTYYETEKIVRLEDGTEIIEPGEEKTYEVPISSYKNYYSATGGSATFNVFQLDAYRMLYGHAKVHDYTKTIKTVSREATISDAYYISDGDSHYLTVGLLYQIVSEDSADASNRWSFVDDNGSTKEVQKVRATDPITGEELWDYVIDEETGEEVAIPVYTVTYPDGYLRAQIGDELLYLRHEGQGSTLSLVVDDDKNSADTWSSDNGIISTTIDGVKYYLCLENGDWCLKTQGQSGERLITNGDGHYLTLTSSGYFRANVTDTTSRENALSWKMTSTGGYTYLTTTLNSQNYYLNINSGNNGLTAARSNRASDNTGWECYNDDVEDPTKYTARAEDTYKYITYDTTNKWTVGDPTYGDSEYLIYYRFNGGNTRYLTMSSSGVSYATSETGATWFTYKDKYLSADIDGTTYYLNKKANNTFDVSETKSTTWSIRDGHFYSGNYYYICANKNGNFELYNGSESQNRKRAIYREEKVIKSAPTFYYVYKNPVSPAVLQFSEQDEEMEVDTEIRTTTEAAAVYTPYTYVPIIADNSQEGYPAKASNTGYICSGTRANERGDIRVSSYAMYDLRNSLNGIASGGSYDSDVGLQILTRTSKSNGLKRIQDKYNTGKAPTQTMGGYTALDASTLGLKKYSASRDQLETTLVASGQNVYGLHFMDAQINMGNIFNADYALINGNEYYNYQLPEDAIDCNLAFKGFINFYAGSYYKQTSEGTNDSFFSLHQIFRDSQNDITDIKQIEEIWTDPDDETKDYVYLYSDGTYSSNKPENYELLFDTQWIETPFSGTTERDKLLYSMFYYEIPVNKGEYALGSVKNHFGAYLIYLDISTNATLSKLEELTELSEVSANSYEYPKGVQVISEASASEIGTSRHIVDTDSAATRIPEGEGGELNINRVGDTITASSDEFTGLTASYKGVKVTLVDKASNELETTPLHSKDIKTKRFIEKEFNLSVNTSTKKVTTTTIITEDDGIPEYRTVYTIDDGPEIEIEPELDEIVVDGKLLRYAYLTPSGAQVTNKIVSGDNITKDCRYFREPGTGWIDITDREALVECLSPYAVTIDTDTEFEALMKFLADDYAATINNNPFVQGGSVVITPSN